MNSSAPAVTVFVAAFQRNPSPRTTLLRSVAPLEDVPCSFAEKSQSLLECRRTVCRIRLPRSISRQPLRLADTRHGEGEGFGAENVALAAFRGRIRLPCGLPRHPAPQPAAEHAEGENLTRRASPSGLSAAHRMPGRCETCRTRDAIPNVRPRIPSGRARPLQPAARATGTSDTGTSPRLLQQSEATGR